MTRPGKALISLEDAPYYRITSRFVQRAYLCGVDHYSGQNRIPGESQGTQALNFLLRGHTL
jgi:hypothetical protein